MGRAKPSGEQMTQPRQPLRFEIIDPDGKRHGPFDNTETMEAYIEQHFYPTPIVFDGEGYDLEFVGSSA